MAKCNDILILGIDHGFKNMKTKNFIFRTALSKLREPPDDPDGILEFQGQCYSIYGKPVTSVDAHNKADNEEFYLLTLPAIAKEMEERKIRKTILRLGTGLPQKWFQSQKESFRNSLMRKKNLDFSYEGRHYEIVLDEVKVYAQGFAAALPVLLKPQFRNIYCVIVDIGGETMDIIPVSGGKIVQDGCRIDTRATIWLQKITAERIEAELYETIPEENLLDMMINGNKESEPKNPYEEIVYDSMTDYTELVYQILREFHINTNIVPIIFAGGGSNIIKNYGNYRPEMTEFITDLRANAAGYELLLNAAYKRK